MLIFLLIILMAAVIPDVIIWNWIFPSLCVGWKLLIFLPTLVVFASMWATLTGRWGHNLSIRMFFGSLLLLAFPKLVFALIAWPFGWIAGLVVAVFVLLQIIPPTAKLFVAKVHESWKKIVPLHFVHGVCTKRTWPMYEWYIGHVRN